MVYGKGFVMMSPKEYEIKKAINTYEIIYDAKHGKKIRNNFALFRISFAVLLAGFSHSAATRIKNH